MHLESVLIRIAFLHALFVAAGVGGAVVFGLPARGLTLGGLAMGTSLVLLWGMGRLTMSGRRLALVVVASLKIVLYLSLITAVLAGGLVADGAGFAAGVTCFVVATVSVVGLSARREQLA